MEALVPRDDEDGRSKPSQHRSSLGLFFFAVARVFRNVEAYI